MRRGPCSNVSTLAEYSTWVPRFQKVPEDLPKCPFAAAGSWLDPIPLGAAEARISAQEDEHLNIRSSFVVCPLRSLMGSC